MSFIGTRGPGLSGLLQNGYRLTPATLAHKLTSNTATSVSPVWIPAKHLLHISKIVAPAIARGNARIIVTMPARHGKSEFTSVHTPTWFLERWPRKNVILTTYGADLSTDFSRRVRDQLATEPPELTVRLNKKSQQVGRFHTSQGGAMYSVGIGGAITGRGGHLLLVDDYIKNAEDSFSEVTRDKIWDWYRSTAFTRLEPGGSVVILATRWHQDDLIGRLLREQGDRWTLIRLPAIAEENDPLGRARGEALWPERYTIEALREIEEVLGSYWFSAMYQQKPMSTMLGMVSGDMLVTTNELPHHSSLKWLRSWDFAASAGAGDYTAGPKVALHKESGRFYITEMPRFQKSPGNTETMVKTCAALDTPSVPIWLEQEPGSAGKIVVEHYAKDVLPAYSVKGLRPTGPLEVRATPFLAAVEAGKVFILEGKWNKTLKDEIDTFPGGTNDDQIAALALAFERLTRGANKSILWGNKVTGWSSPIIRPKTSGIVRGVIW